MKSIFEMSASEYKKASKNRNNAVLWADLDDFSDPIFINENNKYDMYMKHFIAMTRLRRIYERNRKSR